MVQRTAILTAMCPYTLTTLTPCTAQSLCTADCTCSQLQVSLQNVQPINIVLKRVIPEAACSFQHKLLLNSTKCAEQPAVYCTQMTPTSHEGEDRGQHAWQCEQAHAAKQNMRSGVLA